MSDVSLASLAAMYQETLLAQYRAPHNRRELVNATHSASRKNPLCGDALQVAVRFDADVIADAAFSGRGCSIATASASMMTDVLAGRTRDEALALVDDVDSMLTHATPTPHLPIGLDALRAVAPFPARHGCATMPWLALRDALHSRP